MADRINLLAHALTRRAAVRNPLLVWFLLGAVVAGVAGTPMPDFVPGRSAPQAHLMGVERTFTGPTVAPAPGAGVRAFHDPETEAGGTARFEIRWYANPPGIPPGVVVLLESIQERSPVVKNHVLRYNGKSEGHIRSVIDIPAPEIRQAGRILKWRVRVVWRGRLLASQASDNWDG